LEPLLIRKEIVPTLKRRFRIEMTGPALGRVTTRSLERPELPSLKKKMRKAPF